MNHATFAIGILTLWLVASGPVCSDEPQEDAARETSAAVSGPQPLSFSGPHLQSRDAESELLTKLEKRVTLDLEEQPLDSLVKHLQKQTGAPIRIDVIPVEDSGVLPDEPVSGEYVDLPVRTVLSRVLEDLDLTWIVRNEAVVVTTLNKALRRRIGRSFDVMALLKWIEENDPEPERDRFGRIENFWRPPYRGRTPKIVAQTKLGDVVKTIGSGWWEGYSGRGGTVSFSGNIATITQSDHDLKMASRLIELMKSVSASNPRPLVWYLQESGYGTQASREVLSQLQQRMKFESADSPLEDVLAYLSEESGIPIRIDVVSLEESGILPDEPITIAVDNTSLQAILSTILGRLELVHLPRDNGLFITTAAIAWEVRVSALFDVRDLTRNNGISANSLIETVMRETSGQWEDTDPGGVLTVLGGLLFVRQNMATLTEVELLLHDLRRAATGTTPETQRVPKELTRIYHINSSEKMKSVEDAVVKFVFPDKWEANGGAGVIQSVGAALVVRQTEDVHNAVSTFLEELNGDRDASEFGDVDGS